MLDLLGVHLGPPDRLVNAAADNPTGYWEHRPIVALNDEILARLGGNCVRLPAFPAGWESAPELEDLRQRARAILQEAFGGSELWAWKDPRTCLTLPFWQRILPPLRYVICLRHPADVAASLERRGRMPRERAVYLWLAYVRSAFAYTAGLPRCFVCYDRLIDDLPGEMLRLADFIGLSERAEQPEVRDAIASFVDPELRHHRSSSGARPADDRGDHDSSEALRLAGLAYAALASGDPLDEPEIRRALAGGLASIDRKAVPWLPGARALELEPQVAGTDAFRLTPRPKAAP
jgi:hypothetical protein